MSAGMLSPFSANSTLSLTCVQHSARRGPSTALTFLLPPLSSFRWNISDKQYKHWAMSPQSTSLQCKDTGSFNELRKVSRAICENCLWLGCVRGNEDSVSGVWLNLSDNDYWLRLQYWGENWLGQRTFCESMVTLRPSLATIIFFEEADKMMCKCHILLLVIYYIFSTFFLTIGWGWSFSDSLSPEVSEQKELSEQLSPAAERILKCCVVLHRFDNRFSQSRRRPLLGRGTGGYKTLC